MNLLITLFLASTVYPYPSDWNPNVSTEAGRAEACASKYRGRQFTCTVTLEDGGQIVDVIYIDRLPPDQRPGADDMTVPAWSMACDCLPQGRTLRSHRSQFLCGGDGGAFMGTRLAHSDFKGVGQGTPYGGQWTAACDDFDYNGGQ